MGKVDRRQIKTIQKKVLKEVKQANRLPKNKKSPNKEMVMSIHDQMDELLHTDALMYQDLEKHKYVRVPKIRRNSHKVR